MLPPIALIVTLLGAIWLAHWYFFQLPQPVPAPTVQVLPFPESPPHR